MFFSFLFFARLGGDFFAHFESVLNLGYNDKDYKILILIWEEQHRGEKNVFKNEVDYSD